MVSITEPLKTYLIGTAAKASESIFVEESLAEPLLTIAGLARSPDLTC